MKLLDKINCIMHSPMSFVLSKKYDKPEVMNDEKTLDYILEHRCSVCRYGDGEWDLMRNIGIKFQQKDKALKRRLIEIAKNNAGGQSILLCVPNIFSGLNHFASDKFLAQQFVIFPRLLV